MEMSNEPQFLAEEQIAKANLMLGLPDGALAALKETAASIREDEALRSLYAEARRTLFGPEATEERGQACMADLRARLGQRAELFLPLLFLEGIPGAVERYAERGIPQSLFAEAMADMRLWMDDSFAKTGRWGLANDWLYNHLTFCLFQLGRLQFRFGSFAGGISVLRRRTTGEIAVMPDDGERGPSGTLPEAFGADEWEVKLRPGDPVLEVHIPASGKMDYELCGESLRLSAEFFGRYFPEFHYKAYVCTSWLLDPQFRELLAPAANIVRFQREFCLYPVNGDEEEGLRRIFGRLYDNWSEAPQDTSLRRAVVRHLQAGRKLRDTGGFILPDVWTWGDGSPCEK